MGLGQPVGELHFFQGSVGWLMACRVKRLRIKPSLRPVGVHLRLYIACKVGCWSSSTIKCPSLVNSGVARGFAFRIRPQGPPASLVWQAFPSHHDQLNSLIHLSIFAPWHSGCREEEGREKEARSKTEGGDPCMLSATISPYTNR